MRRNGFSAPHGIHAFVRLALHAHARDVDAERGGHTLADAIEEWRDLRPFENDDDVHVDGLETGVAHERGGAAQQVDARRALPRRIGVGKVPPDGAARTTARQSDEAGGVAVTATPALG